MDGDGKLNSSAVVYATARLGLRADKLTSLLANLSSFFIESDAGQYDLVVYGTSIIRRRRPV
jgi:hypothetical protein